MTNPKWRRETLPAPHDAAMQHGIRRRWMINSLGTVLAVVLVGVVVFSIAISNYYYSAMRSTLENKAKSASDFISSYATNQSAYLEMANYYITDFDERSSLELQFLNSGGRIVLSSYSITSGGQPGTTDVDNAINNQILSCWIGKSPNTGERIMAVSSPIISNGEVKGVMRLVTGLSAADQQIILFVCVALLAAVIIMAMLYSTNIYFIRSIVDPMASITETAKRIAAGGYGIQIEKKYNDEIGELVDTINEMSMKISQNEKMKSEFISSVSHELRTPLTAINGWSETLLSGEITDPDSTRKGLSIIASEGRRLSKMVEELLEFSRIEDGRFTLNVEPVDIKAEFEDAVFTYQQFYRKKGIKLIHHDCDEDFPLIPGDPERLRQVFSNLLDNAAKHGGSGKKVETFIARDGDSVCIRIRDYGPGVPEKDLPHVKEKFYKGASKARGNGIGLAVCDEIIGRLGGTLTVGNANGGGCAITIYLPMTSPTTKQ